MSSSPLLSSNSRPNVLGPDGNRECPTGGCDWLGAEANGSVIDEEIRSPDPEYRSDGGAIFAGPYFDKKGMI